MIPMLHFASCFVYSPRAHGAMSDLSRRLCDGLKSADPVCLPKYAGVVQEQFARHGRFQRVFGRDVVLVPVPGSSVSANRVPDRVPQEGDGARVAHAARGMYAIDRVVCERPQQQRVWSAERLAIALYTIGLAGAVWRCLRRISAVRRSASSLAGQRPAVHEHYASFAVEKSATVEAAGSQRKAPLKQPPERIVLIDDVITKGRTLLAAATRMREAFPYANLQAFALVRTLGIIDTFGTLLAPCEGLVRWSGGDARRDP